MSLIGNLPNGIHYFVKIKIFTSFHLLKFEKRKKLNCGQNNAALKIVKKGRINEKNE